ncbi:MAG TPA: bifunctional adenosylcobinamide kinase/adenosylcobinamide-phosphate guanylyltransferase, partial [Elusimicrobiota bacterium]|nr:bifunctional adenosylcobinamide kinase/adenosylcobinamide-phosphate guanylyltransferase [Elusimicrobiota bacterium]
LTLWVSNMLLRRFSCETIQKDLAEVLRLLKKGKAASVVVANEVGLGIVPANKLARNFRDVAGRVNQQVAEKADRVIFMVSGIPWRIK